MRLVPTVVVCASLGLASCSSSKTDEVKPAAKAPESAAAKAERDENDEDELDVRDLAAEAKVSLGQALETAMHAYPAGVAVAAELEGEMEGGRRRVAYEIAFVNVETSEVRVVKVDPVTREVLSSEKEDEADEAREAMDRYHGAGGHPMRLLDLLHRAMEHGAGTPVSIEYGRRRPSVAKATFVQDGAKTSVTLRAGSGAVFETK